MNQTEQINAAAALCREAFVGIPVGHPVWCCHHEKHFEKLEEPAENRILYILLNKPIEERVERLKNFRPFKNPVLYADYAAKRAPLYADYDAKRAPLDADYAAKCAALYADYAAKCAPLDADMVKAHKEEWPENTWNGETIFT